MVMEVFSVPILLFKLMSADIVVMSNVCTLYILLKNIKKSTQKLDYSLKFANYSKKITCKKFN